MTKHTPNYSNIQDHSYGPLPEGTYEMVVNKVQETATKSGAESLQIDLIVRNDLDGVPELKDTNAQYHNRHVFNDNWKRKTTKEYDLDGMDSILKAAGWPDKKAVDYPDEFIKFMSHKPVKVFVKNEDNTYQGKTSKVNRVAPWNYSTTDFPNVAHKFKTDDINDAANNAQVGMNQASTQNGTADPFANNGQPIDISDDDLPF